MSLTFIRTTISGAKEYWDDKQMKIVSYPKGTEPPKELLNTHSMIGDYTLSGKVKDVKKTKVDEVETVEETKTIEQQTAFKEVIESTEEPEREETFDNDEQPNFEEMTLKQLRDYAKERNIDIPSDVRKKSEIIEILLDAE